METVDLCKFEEVVQKRNRLQEFIQEQREPLYTVALAGLAEGVTQAVKGSPKDSVTFDMDE